jgi:hypothetical protein
MPTVDRNLTYPNCQVPTRVIYVGGRSGVELLEDLKKTGVEINDLGLRLLISESFKAPETSRPFVIAELTVRNLGLPRGGRISEIIKYATDFGLSLCPMELGPYLRLQYLDQPEGFFGQPTYQHRAPPGSVTIASEPPVEDDDFPKGFYLRCIKGVLWLRGYRSEAQHVWNPDDHLVFCKP